METHNIVLLLRGGAVKVCIALCMAASGYKIILFHKMPRDIKAGIMGMRARRDFYANRARSLPRSTHTAIEAPTDRPIQFRQAPPINTLPVDGKFAR
jgi:hypothetical protein